MILLKSGLSLEADQTARQKGDEIKHWLFPMRFVTSKPRDRLYFLIDEVGSSTILCNTTDYNFGSRYLELYWLVLRRFLGSGMGSYLYHNCSLAVGHRRNVLSNSDLRFSL